MALLQNIWWYLVLIGVMILVHEFGHYFAARFFDVKVETFSFGFGPRLFGFRRGETDFRFSLILFGGYVKMTGEQPGDEGAADPRALTSKPRWQRLLIAFAGPAINIVLAVALLTGLFMVHYEKVPNPHSPVIGYVAPDSAAAKAGIKLGDKIVQIDEITDPTWEQVAIKSAMNPKQPLDVWVMRGGEHLHMSLTPALEEKQSIGNAGWQQESEIEVAGVLKDMDGARVGLQRGDILVSVNGQPLRSIPRLNEIENETNGAPLDLVYSRKGQQHAVKVKPAKRDIEGQGGARWMIGLTLQPRVEITKLALPEALSESWRQNLLNTQLIVKSLEGIVRTQDVGEIAARPHWHRADVGRRGARRPHPLLPADGGSQPEPGDIQSVARANPRWRRDVDVVRRDADAPRPGHEGQGNRGQGGLRVPDVRGGLRDL